MNIMSKSFPVVVRLEWASENVSTARYLATLGEDHLPRALHAPSIKQVSLGCMHDCMIATYLDQSGICRASEL